MTAPAGLTTALGDRYGIEREIGAGGMATVYLARDRKHDRDVALKVLRPELTAVLGAERFLNEVRITARLDHPHILTLIDSGADAGALWFVLPYVRGESLRARLLREKQLGLDEALAITKQIASALDYAHQRGVIHRDIKPENILLHEGEAVVADFGIALAVREAGGNRLTETGLSLGTPQYMSPEQATGDRPLDARSDIYSLGAVLYEMLAGEPPHTGATAQAVIAKLMTERPTRIRTVRDTVPEGIDNAVARALAKVPGDRFPSATDFAVALGRATESARPRARRVSGLVVGVAAAFTVVALGAGGWLVLRRSSTPKAFSPQLVQLTTDGNARSPSLSPDGTRLAYWARQCDSLLECTDQLVVRDTGGAGLVTLMQVPRANILSWTSGGRFLVAGVDQPAGVHAVPTLGGTPRLLGCCFATALGATDTILMSPFPRAAADSVTWLKFVTVSDGAVHDSVPVRPFGNPVIGVVQPGQKHVVVTHFQGATVSLSLHDRSGRITDSVLDLRGVSLAAWTPRSDAVISLWDRWVQRRRVSADGRFIGPVDSLFQLPPGGRLGHLREDGTTILSQGQAVSQVWALERSRPGRLEFSKRLLASSTAELTGNVSRDGATVWLTRQGTGLARRDVFVPWRGEGETPFSLPRGEIVDHAWSRPVSSEMLVAVRSSSRQVRLAEVSVSTGVVRDIEALPEGTQSITAVPGGGLAIHVGGAAPALHLRHVPGRRDTVWALPSEPGRAAYVAWIDAREVVLASASANGDTAWLRRHPLTGGAGREVGRIGYTGGVNLLWSVFPPDGSVEYVLTESSAGPLGTFTGFGWYRIPPTGGAGVRLGTAPLQGNVQQGGYTDDGRRLVGFMRVYQPDAYLVQNFAELLRP